MRKSRVWFISLNTIVPFADTHFNVEFVHKKERQEPASLPAAIEADNFRII
jgi:hypothetical protein